MSSLSQERRQRPKTTTLCEQVPFEHGEDVGGCSRSCSADKAGIKNKRESTREVRQREKRRASVIHMVDGIKTLGRDQSFQYSKKCSIDKIMVLKIEYLK
jgi:hypothetical protein